MESIYLEALIILLKCIGVVIGLLASVQMLIAIDSWLFFHAPKWLHTLICIVVILTLSYAAIVFELKIE